MAVTVEIPAPLREATGGQTAVAVAGETVAAALADLIRQYPLLESKLFQNGQLRPYINVFVNDEDIRYLEELQTPVADGTTIALIPAVAGG
ncbi:MAG: ubiquitin-like small modifier protein 1 [Thermogemmata sp.]|jgi:molybdopterin converting factor small subunit|uniref:MoaD/ThiS family protein n=1 Tax=Thermogemmata fonticola TaxID=2755323 RepID=A0A7V8VH82_9BACT|nr:ubiquitin-like small modifier protein 1 [Thermogemmata fonticola]MBA2227896.1 MoaD/ThiS family protein [Thermogemmata fonticola]MCX8140064.1 MoaD/ThiS family protein [Gemmataceae bacterium]